MKILAIAFNTYKEAVRNKIFYLLITFAILFVLSSHVVSLLVISDRMKIIKDFGLAAIDFFGVLIAIFTGINLVYKEIERKTIHTILTKPIPRSTFILGKFMGLSLTLLVSLGAMFTVFSLFLLASSGSVDPNVLLYFVFLFMQLMVLVALSLLFSSFSTPILSSIFTICLYLIGQVLWTLMRFKEHFSGLMDKVFLNFVYYVLPNFYKFNIKSDIVLGRGIPADRIANALLYGITYTGAVLLLTVLLFEKREIK